MKSNEHNFIKRLKNQKEDALEYVYDMYIPYVKTIILNVLGKFGDRGMVEECIDDVFISVWNNADQFTGSTNDFKKWICAITRFKSIDYYRNRIKNTEQYLNELDIKEKISLEDEIIMMENKEEINRLLNSLDGLDNQVFVMKYFMGLKAEEIATRLNLSISSVNSRVYRGKKKLKERAIELGWEVI